MMINKKYFFLILSILFSNLIFAAKKTCTDTIIQNDAVNLDNVRNQDTVGWCYAYAASDLVSYRLNKKVSAVSFYDQEYLSIEQDIANRSLTGGEIQDTIYKSHTRLNGFCLEEDLPSSDFKFCTDQKYFHFLDNFIRLSKNKNIVKDLPNNQCLQEGFKQAFPQLKSEDIADYNKQFGSFKFVEYLYQLKCKRTFFKEQIPRMRTRTFNLRMFKPDVLIKTIDEQLNAKEIIGIGYDYDKLNGKNVYGPHASVVVGRQFNKATNSCEYLVRNSYGKDCDLREVDGLTCHKVCEKGACRYTGHFWVSEERLKNSIMSVTFFDTP